ncbi:unnamed protein product [Didymodactylos carnosus]|uniref:Uncharacterized protein n=1 Tax=Didymodactylos carnosus TaxID=1234261 RepID=A0A814L5J5_9BILA|nr:unnamed protein product [Didymodactylos carnosus]CAF3828850.1 unnamed protein product [Didymodactylos carnosus]
MLGEHKFPFPPHNQQNHAFEPPLQNHHFQQSALYNSTNFSQRHHPQSQFNQDQNITTQQFPPPDQNQFQHLQTNIDCRFQNNDNNNNPHGQPQHYQSLPEIYSSPYSPYYMDTSMGGLGVIRGRREGVENELEE